MPHPLLEVPRAHAAGDLRRQRRQAALEAEAKRSAEAFRANAAKSEFEVYADKSGKHRWRAKSSNGQTVASGGEAFDSQSSARRAATNVQKNVGKAAVG